MNSNEHAAERVSQPRTTNEAYEWAQAAFQRGDFDSAISLCRQILEISPDSVVAFDLLGSSLLRSGKIREEIESLNSAIDSGSEKPDLYGKLGELQRIAGELGDAIVSLNLAAAADPDNSVIRVSLGMALFNKGDLAAAEKEFLNVVDMEPRSAPAHSYLGAIYRRTGRKAEARTSYTTALDHNTNHPQACFGLAILLFQDRASKNRLEDLEQAAGLLQRAIDNGADKFNCYLLTGKIFLETEQYQKAREILESAAKLERKHPDLYVALSVTYVRLNEVEKATNVIKRFMQEFPMRSRTSANPEARILVLETLYYMAFVRPLYGQRTHAYANTIADLRPKRVSMDHIYVQGIKMDDIKSYKDKYGVIFNNIANAESNAEWGYTEQLKYLIDATGLPVINHPDLIDMTSRVTNYARLSKLNHLIFPKTVLVNPDLDNTAEIIEQVEADFMFPVLVRIAGNHRASNLGKADDIDALRDLLVRFAKTPCYVIQYHESKHHTGSYLRYRGVFIGGKFYPSRLNLSNSWLVAASAARKNEKNPIEGSRDLQNEEMRWLADPAGTIGQANMTALLAADDIIKLDFCGFDFGIAEDGQVIVFEANACMNALSIRKHVAKYPYLAKAAKDIESAFENLMIDKAQGRC